MQKLRATPAHHRPLVILFASLLWSAGCQDSPSATPDGGTAGNPPPTKKVGMTFYKDVLPITQVHCQGCHQASGIGPFPIVTYDDAKAAAAAMSGAVQSRTMPPWMPSPSCQSFRNPRTLTQDQIDTIYSWADDGAPAGNVSDAPPPPPMQVGLSWIDRTLGGGSAYTPNTAVTDDYHCFVLDPALATDQTLVGYDITPGVRAEVHHVLVYAGSLSEAQAKDAATPEVGYTCYGGPGLSSTTLVAAWVPGSGATTFPTDTGVPIKAGSGLVMQIHYNLANGATPDQSSLQMQFARQPISRPATITPIAQTKFTIPPMSTGYTASKTLTLPAASTLWGVAPHMHMLGRDAQLQATTADGQSSCLIDIPKWDFHWQQLYFYDSPSGITLAAGTRLTYSCTWDNPGPNPISWGESTTDEMCITYLYVTE
jgi:mono/diheme cytochrome c family protein